MAVADDLKALLKSPEAQAALKEIAADEHAEANKPAEYYVHLADGNVVTMKDEESSGSHVDGIQVIARYLVGA
jgi:hypothetical protein